jgi:hypothetical protein
MPCGDITKERKGGRDVHEELLVAAWVAVEGVDVALAVV